MELSVSDRLAIPSLFPMESSKIKYAIMEGIRNKLKITPEESVLIGYKEKPFGDGSVSYSWDNKKEKSINVDFDEVELLTIRDFIDKLDKAEKITPFQLVIVKKFEK